MLSTESETPNLLYKSVDWLRDNTRALLNWRVFVRLAILASILSLIFIFADWVTLHRAVVEKSFFDYFALALYGFMLVLTFCLWLISYTLFFATAVNNETLNLPVDERWKEWKPESLADTLLCIALPAWLGMLPGQIVGTTFYVATGSLLGFLLLSLISGIVFSPLTLLSTIYNGNKFSLMSPRIFGTLTTQFNIWLRFYLASFVLLLVALPFYFVLNFDWAVVSVLVALILTGLLALYAQISATHFNQVLIAIETPASKREIDVDAQKPATREVPAEPKQSHDRDHFQEDPT
ncbi:MAG TPA: hypothetical protein PKD64_02665 [Pirellulaceae bacterium]|nr:hypothetical protein [Pirellulaceae bacterium]HMO91072.1 hypothetical protein [Pirellulaceae bacterium]HMP68186.1 hypothetical protein [Pirellulaceae bacterium]